MDKKAVECQYCGHFWHTWLYDEESAAKMTCPICGDCRIRMHHYGDVFGYEHKAKGWPMKEKKKT